MPYKNQHFKYKNKKWKINFSTKVSTLKTSTTAACTRLVPIIWDGLKLPPDYKIIFSKNTTQTEKLKYGI